jgi:hypothetical protein
MSSTTSEKLVKYTIKAISKKYNLEYEELKVTLKKVIKTARNYDESILGIMEEIMDLGNVGSVEELEDFNIEVLKIYCKIKEIDIDGISDRHIRSRVWKYIESEFEFDDEDDDDDEDESVVDSDEEESEEEEEEEEIKVKSEKKHHHKKKSSSGSSEKIVELVE